MPISKLPEIIVETKEDIIASNLVGEYLQSQAKNKLTNKQTNKQSQKQPTKQPKKKVKTKQSLHVFSKGVRSFLVVIDGTEG